MAIKSPSGTDLRDYIGFAATIAALILSVIAIFQTIIGQHDGAEMAALARRSLDDLSIAASNISTTSENETQYVLSKHMAEAYLINKTSNGFVLRVPMFIGPRVISNFKDDSKKPYGTMELIHTRDVVEKIKELLNYDGVKRFHTLHGEKISAQLIYDLVRI